MATRSEPSSTTAKSDNRHRSVFEVPHNYFDSCALLPSPLSVTSETPSKTTEALESLKEDDSQNPSQNPLVAPRLTCNICKSEFDSLLDQRSHFKSDIHGFNVKLSLAGKSILKEDDFDELTPDSFKDFDVSSISGSEDEAEKEPQLRKGLVENSKKKLFIQLQTGERVSVWKCLVTDESEDVIFENDRFFGAGGIVPGLKGKDVVDRLKSLIHEPRDGTRLRILLMVSGGHFAGCVFDGSSVIAHKTFHRYVVRAKAGKKQSSKDAGGGRTIHSAGASLRRYNELALKKEIQELLATWKPYFDASSCVFVNAPSNSRQLIYNAGKPCFSHTHCAVRNIPLMVRRPTFKEARRLYDQLTQITHEVDEWEVSLNPISDSLSSEGTAGNSNGSQSIHKEVTINASATDDSNKLPSDEVQSEAPVPCETENSVICLPTPLHEAARSNHAEEVLELLEQGLDPCATDERGRTPYMLASEKEVRNTFRRFMALNLDRWDWNAAKVPSALTKEMEDSQAAKQAEKDAKRKARAKELKKLRKTKDKKAQAEAEAEAVALNNASKDQGSSSAPAKGQSQPSILRLSKEEELKRQQAMEREKRAAAAERRMAATSTTTNPQSGLAGSDVICSCCNVSLAGKVPFHRYNYKYCSTSCMHLHKEMLEDG